MTGYLEEKDNDKLTRAKSWVEELCPLAIPMQKLSPHRLQAEGGQDEISSVNKNSKKSTSAVIHTLSYLKFIYPSWWKYSILVQSDLWEVTRMISQSFLDSQLLLFLSFLGILHHHLTHRLPGVCSEQVA